MGAGLGGAGLDLSTSQPRPTAAFVLPLALTMSVATTAVVLIVIIVVVVIVIGHHSSLLHTRIPRYIKKPKTTPNNEQGGTPDPYHLCTGRKVRRVMPRRATLHPLSLRTR